MPATQGSYYLTAEWRALRAACLKRDNYQCTVNGCPKRASHADHIKARNAGGTDTLSNLRSLCWSHHSSKTVQADGGFGHRSRDASLKVKGCDADGWPLDPSRR